MLEINLKFDDSKGIEDLSPIDNLALPLEKKSILKELIDKHLNANMNKFKIPCSLKFVQLMFAFLLLGSIIGCIWYLFWFLIATGVSALGIVICSVILYFKVQNQKQSLLDFAQLVKEKTQGEINLVQYYEYYLFENCRPDYITQDIDVFILKIVEKNTKTTIIKIDNEELTVSRNEQKKDDLMDEDTRDSEQIYNDSKKEPLLS